MHSKKRQLVNILHTYEDRVENNVRPQRVGDKFLRVETIPQQEHLLSGWEWTAANLYKEEELLQNIILNGDKGTTWK